MKLNGFKISHFATKLPLGCDVEKCEQANTTHLHLDPVADVKSNDAFGGLIGSFIPVKNDFSYHFDGMKCQRDRRTGDEKPKAAKHVRFLICTLALAAFTLSLMTRIILNVSIVEMTRSHTSSTILDEDLDQMAVLKLNDTAIEEEPLIELEDQRFDWSARVQNFLLSSFYFGLCPSMLLSGGLAESYGSKYLLLVCIVGSGVINLLTPLVARYSLPMLICLRVLLGVLQGGLIPASYDLFNKWLTITETSIFVPLIKLSSSFGILIGSMLPGLTKSLGFQWPMSFYLASCACLVWSIIWYMLATSNPQSNWMVKPAEVKHIQRKKQVVSTIAANGDQPVQLRTRQPTPWFLIVTNSSVIALIIVKYTYNMGMDFMLLELAVYLKNVHKAPIEKISMVGSGGALMQISLITFVGWAAKELIKRKTFGLSKTRWRKIFQGTSNFGLGTIYLILPFASARTDLSIALIICIYFLWMFGAAGEAMIPYDLSINYPATIAGIAQSISVLSGISVPILCGSIIGDDSENSDRWGLLFFLFGGALYLGGVVFVIFLKAKPFLPGERPIEQNGCTGDGAQPVGAQTAEVAINKQ